MARSSSSKPGNSKLRFIMLEADLSEGDLSQVTQAIQNALRPVQPIQQRLIRSPADSLAGTDDQSHSDTDDIDGFEIDHEVPQKQRSQRTSKPRAARIPSVINDLDVKTAPSLQDYVAQFDLKTSFEKYLVIAHWLRETRGVDATTVDHVYTCYRLLGWSTGSADFEKPLRNMRANQWVTGGSKEGYSLTLTGADKIEKRKIAN